MGIYNSKLTNILQEFDELVEIQNLIIHAKFNSVEDLFNIFRSPSRETVENQKRLYSLPQDQYFAVVNAANAIETFGKGKIGIEVYNKNKSYYFLSKKVNQIFKNF